MKPPNPPAPPPAPAANSPTGTSTPTGTNAAATKRTRTRTAATTRTGNRPAPPSPPPSHGDVLSTEVCTTTEAFAELAPEWERLHARCTPATPFQTHAWLHSWWLGYGTAAGSRGLRVILVRRHQKGGHRKGVPDGELVAAAPMMRTMRPLPVLVPLGGAISDFSDVLLDDAYAAPAAPVLAEALAEAAAGALIDFREVRPGAALEHVHACWPGPRRVLADSVCLELPAGPMDDLVARLPSSRRQRVRSNLRRLAALGVERRVVAPHEVPGALRVLLDLHRAQWQGRRQRVTREHLRPRFAAHLERAVGALAGRGAAAVTEFRVDGTVLAADLTLLGPRLTGGYLFGADPLLRARKVDLTTMLLLSATQHQATGPGTLVPAGSQTARTGRAGRTVLSMLRGDELHKWHWRPERLVNQRFLLAPRPVTVPLLAATAHVAASRTRARALLHGGQESGDESERHRTTPDGTG